MPNRLLTFVWQMKEEPASVGLRHPASFEATVTLAKHEMFTTLTYTNSGELMCSFSKYPIQLLNLERVDSYQASLQ